MGDSGDGDEGDDDSDETDVGESARREDDECSVCECELDGVEDDDEMWSLTLDEADERLVE